MLTPGRNILNSILVNEILNITFAAENDKTTGI